MHKKVDKSLQDKGSVRANLATLSAAGFSGSSQNEARPPPSHVWRAAVQTVRFDTAIGAVSL